MSLNISNTNDHTEHIGTQAQRIETQMQRFVGKVFLPSDDDERNARQKNVTRL